jgi:hypothetical protein
MKFYVNEIHDRSLTGGIPYGQSIIGLFKQCATEGRGSFCGYYGAEFYIDTEMYAYYVADCSGIYKPEARITGVVILEQPTKYREVAIGSHMWTSVIEAESIEEAIRLFEDAKWRRWDCRIDEVK